MVATLVLLDCQVAETVPLVPSLYVAVAVMVAVSPTVNVAADAETFIAVMLRAGGLMDVSPLPFTCQSPMLPE